MLLIELPKPLDFEWDEGNKNKSLLKHKINIDAAEQIFRDSLKHIVNDRLHSQEEQRLIILGHTFIGKILVIAFTIRNNRIRVISAHGASKKEREWYEEKISTPQI